MIVDVDAPNRRVPDLLAVAPFDPESRATGLSTVRSTIQLYLVFEKPPLLLPISITVALADEVNTTEPFPTLSKTALSTSETTSAALILQFREVDEQCVGSLSVAGPLVRMQEERFLSELPEQFMHAASKIELSLRSVAGRSCSTIPHACRDILTFHVVYMTRTRKGGSTASRNTAMIMRMFFVERFRR